MRVTEPIEELELSLPTRPDKGRNQSPSDVVQVFENQNRSPHEPWEATVSRIYRSMRAREAGHAVAAQQDHIAAADKWGVKIKGAAIDAQEGGT